MKILLVFLVIAAIVKAALIHGHLRQIAGEEGCFFGYCLQHDAILFSLLLLGWFIHDAFLKRRAARMVVRLGLLSVALFYLLDILILLNFNTHLYVNDLLKYAAGVPGAVASLLRGSASLRVWAGVALLLAALMGFLYLLLREHPPLGKFSQRLLPVAAFFCLGAFFLPSGREYVHAWAYQNFVAYNASMWSQHIGYSEGFRKAFKPLGAVIHEDCAAGRAQRQDLVLLVLESLSMYHSRRFSGLRDWVPRFDAIAADSVLFENFYANGFSTEEGLISLLTGKVPLSPPDLATNGGIVTFDGFFGSEHSLPALLRERGYDTEFLTTGNLAFSHKGEWLRSLGFAYVEGHEHPFYEGYPRFHFDAAPDEALYARARDRIFATGRDRPLFLVIETVSTHHPFIDPVSGDFSEEGAFRYADEQLGWFYDELRQKGFFENGILIISSDHRSMTPLTREEVALYGLERAAARIPMVLVGREAGARVVEDPFQLTDIYQSLRNAVREEKCTSLWQGDFLQTPPVPPAFILHKSGFQRNLVYVFGKDEQYRVKLDGDRTRVVSEPSPGNDLAGLLVNKIHYERILLAAAKEKRGKEGNP